MKNIFIKTSFLLLTVVLFSVACQDSADTEPQATESRESEESVAEQMYSGEDDHNSRNSLDYEGLYSGTVPCADCEGIFTELIIKPGNQFSISTRYLGKEDDSEFSKNGEYNWIDGNRIELLGVENAPNKYLVGENQVWQLDMEGERITGDLASKYILKKKI